MAAEREVGLLITTLLQKREKHHSKAEIGLRFSPHVHDIDRQWETPLSAEYLRWRAITGSGDNLATCPDTVIIQIPKQAYA